MSGYDLIAFNKIFRFGLPCIECSPKMNKSRNTAFAQFLLIFGTTFHSYKPNIHHMAEANDDSFRDYLKSFQPFLHRSIHQKSEPSKFEVDLPSGGDSTDC